MFLEGRVTILKKHSQTGRIERVQSNLVVNNTYDQLAHLVGGDYTNREVKEVRMGTGAIAPAASDVAITPLTACIWLPVTATYPADNQVNFHAVWNASVVRSEDIAELGLFFTDNLLCARTVFSTMRKSQYWSWEIDWLLYYSRDYV